MLFRSTGVVVVIAALVLSPWVLAATPESALDSGMRAWRAGDYASAAVDLQTAVEGFASREAVDDYVEGGQLRRLASLETGLVYLALAQFRLGQEEAARATLFRLVAAEEIAPAYASLPLGADAAELESLAAALIPGVQLPPNLSGLPDDPDRPLPAVSPADTQLSRSGEEREQIEERLNALPLFPSSPAPSANVRPSTVQTAVPEVRPEEPAIQLAAPFNERPAIEPAPRSASPSMREALLALRKAEALVDNGLAGEARAIYAELAGAGDVAREVLIEAAVGLYRLGAHRDAVPAFRRLGMFARGEEDLRYYYSVALYESGDYTAAQLELRCALPFVRVTDEVLRYQLKIDRMQAAFAATN